MRRTIAICFVVAIGSANAATNLPQDQKSQEAEPVGDGDGYEAGSDPIWIEFFSGGGGGGSAGEAAGGGGSGIGTGARAACVRCRDDAEGAYCEAVVGGSGKLKCRTENGTCKAEGVCFSLDRQ